MLASVALERPMPVNLSIRNLDDDVAGRMRIRAAEHGRSTEAEVRVSLAEALVVAPADDFDVRAARIRAMSAGRQQTPAEILQADSRNER